MVRRESVGIGMLGDLALADRAPSLEQNSQKATTVREIPDQIGGLSVDSRVHEPKQEPILAYDSDCSVSSPYYFAC
jgi:hypothetical protein